MKIFELHSLTYSYDKNKKILKSINAQMETGKMYAILGPSGCGKTTLLSLLGGLDSPASGSVLFEGKDIAQIGLARHRKKNVSFIFQSYNLIDYLTPVENVALTSKLPPLPILERLGLTKEESKRNVLKLSGGQQQRVAIARALASEAPIILADEPTGNLDSKTTMEILKLMRRIVREQQQTLIMVTHDNHLASYADRLFHIVDGKIFKIEELHHEDDLEEKKEDEKVMETGADHGNGGNDGDSGSGERADGGDGADDGDGITHEQ